MKTKIGAKISSEISLRGVASWRIKPITSLKSQSNTKKKAELQNNLNGNPLNNRTLIAFRHQQSVALINTKL